MISVYMEAVKAAKKIKEPQVTIMRALAGLETGGDIQAGAMNIMAAALAMMAPLKAETKPKPVKRRKKVVDTSVKFGEPIRAKRERKPKINNDGVIGVGEDAE